MKIIENLLSPQIIDAFGWTLLHSLWQGALISIIVAFLMIFLQKYPAKTRYLVHCCALVMVFGMAIITFFHVYEPGEKVLVGMTLQDNVPERAYLSQELARAENSGEARTDFFITARDYFQENLPLFVAIWFAGMIVFFLRFLGSMAYVQRLKYHRTYNAGRDWQDYIRRLSGYMGIRKKIRLMESALAKIPMVAGHFRPVILVPLGMLSSVPPQQLEAILAHEMAHIYRKDYIINIIQSIIEVLFFYHPAIWWLSKNIRIEREHICDDMALAHCDNTLEYARALARIKEMESTPPVAATAFSGNKKYLLFNRIQRMMNKPGTVPNFTEGFISAVVIFSGIIILTAGTLLTFERSDAAGYNPDYSGIADMEGRIQDPFIDYEEDLAENVSAVNEEKHIVSVSLKKQPASSNSGAAISLNTKNRAKSAFDIHNSFNMDPRNGQLFIALRIPDTLTERERDSIMDVFSMEMEKARQAYEEALQMREEAMGKVKEALEAQKEAQRKVQQEIQKRIQDELEDEKELLKEYQQRLKEICKNDSSLPHLRYHGHFPGSRNRLFIDEDIPWFFFGGKGYIFEDDCFDKHFDLGSIYIDSLGSFNIDSGEFHFRYQGDWTENFLDEWKDNLYDLHENFEEVEENLEDLNYHYFYHKNARDCDRHHDNYLFYHFPKSKTSNMIEKELRKDGLIRFGEDYVLEINNRHMLLNGEKQSRELYKKYKRLYESLSDDEINSDHSYKLIR